MTLAVQYDILTPEGSNIPHFKRKLLTHFCTLVDANDRINVSLDLGF